VPPGAAPAYQYPYPAYPSRGTNGFAIASLVCSLVVCGIGSVLGIVFGHIARRQIRRTHEGGGGLAIAGLVVGYVGIAAAVAFILTVVVFGPSFGPNFAHDDARSFERRVVAYAQLTGTAPRDPRAIQRALPHDCCSRPTIADTGISVKGASTFELTRAGWRIQFGYSGEPGTDFACLTIPEGTTIRRTDIRDGRCHAPDAAGNGV
jgi:hypothetical protein